MKITCSKCSQKHSVADQLIGDRKILRISCRRCGQALKVRVMKRASASDAGAGQDSILFTWKTVGSQPLDSLKALPPARKTPPPPPRPRRATPPPIPRMRPTMPTIELAADLKAEIASELESKPLPPELPAEASQPAGVTSGILDMLAIADGYFSDETVAPPVAVAVVDEPDFAAFTPQPYERTMQIVLPPQPAKRSSWKYAVSGTIGAAIAMVATLAVLKVERPTTMQMGAALADARSFQVGSDLGGPEPAFDEWTELTSTEPTDETDPDTTTDPDETTRTTPRKPLVKPRKPTVTVRTTPRPVVKPKTTSKEHVVWDEVECMIVDNPPKVCAPFLAKHKPTTAVDGGGADKAAHASLTRNLINTGINKVRWRVDQCGTRGWGAGQVVVSFKVDKAGNVTSALISSAPNSNLAACVKQHVTRARFAKTRSGGSFSYLFSFR